MARRREGADVETLKRASAPENLGALRARVLGALRRGVARRSIKEKLPVRRASPLDLSVTGFI